MPKRIANRVYDFYARFYGGFEMIFRNRIARAIQEMNLHDGDRVLDIGIGTGVSLEFYPDAVSVVGLDRSAGMLASAAKRVSAGTVRGNATAATQLVHGDALELPFPDEAFDAVFLSHVIATVPDPHAALAEAIRVARPNARITLVNHFQNPIPPINWIEAAIDPLCRKLGWRTDLSLRDVLLPAGVTDLSRPRGIVFQTVHLAKTSHGLRMIPQQQIDRQAATRAVLETQ